MAFVDVESPRTPADWSVATRLPAATPPPLAIAAADIILAAMEAAAMPVPVKPMAARATGAPATARAPPMAEPKQRLRGSDKSSQNRQLEKCFPALKMVSVLISLESLEAQSLSLSASLESEAAASLPSS